MLPVYHGYGVTRGLMTDAFDEAQVGDSRAISGVLDGVKYFLWALKEPNYVMKMMATGGSLMMNDSCCTTSCCWIEGGVPKSKEFTYTLPFDHHFHYPHAVDDHNNLRHSLPSWEDTWVTQCWELHVFAFIIVVCEVNAY